MRCTFFTRYRSRRAALSALGALALLPTSLVLADDSSFTSKAGLDTQSGAAIYSNICQGCHMPQAQGAVGAGHYPALAGDPKLISWEYAAITVLRGRNDMPSFALPPDQAEETRAVHLSDAQIAEVVNYVRQHFGNHFKQNITAQQVAGLPHPAAEPAR
jgi:mono/diheme cytochrome c family protein